MIKIILLSLVLFVALLWFTPLVWFSAADHSQYDLPRPVVVGEAVSEQHQALAQLIQNEQGQPALGLNRAEQLTLSRQQMDARGAAIPIQAEIIAVNDGAIKGEWVLASNADTSRRLLYLHGGAYMMGSAQSHRGITGRLSAIAGAAVLALNYRLLPENTRSQGIDDCRQAYQWLLSHGPNGPAPSKTLIVAGDSAGGNLALSTIAWARDLRLPSADAVVVMSPQTDVTLASPSLRSNAPTDVMQGMSFGPVVNAPKPVYLWMMALLNRMNPRNTDISPLLADLSGLPPTLIQVSASEMFFDDAVRYANKAAVQGSLVELQAWPQQMHVWQAFDIPEADAAFAKWAHL